MKDAAFRGWVKPGPSAAYGVEIEDGETLDAISGDYRLFQLRDGHRFSTDDVLTAWYATSWCPSARTVLDLGSGIGTVGMIAAWRLQGARFVTVEAQDDSVRLARKSCRYNGLSDRYDIRHGDFRSGVLKPDETFDLIMGSPPYFAMDAGDHGDHPQKIACRFEMRGTVADYAALASTHLAPGGLFACVFPVQPDFQEQRVVSAAADAGLTIVRRRVVGLKECEPPLVGVFAMMRSADLPGVVSQPDLGRAAVGHSPA